MTARCAAEFPMKTGMSRSRRLARSLTSRECPEYNFDEIGIWFFAIERKAKRSNKATGTVRGVTDIIETVNVDGDEYRKKVIGKDSVFDRIREKMWWFHKNSGKPEAGQTLYYQHDGATPHDCDKNKRVWAQNRRMKGFDILVVKQPAQSPDLNVCDLAFFNSLQSDTECAAASNMKELKEIVLKAWDEYPADRLESCWRCLTTSMHGILETGGDNVYQTREVYACRRTHYRRTHKNQDVRMRLNRRTHNNHP